MLNQVVHRDFTNLMILLSTLEQSKNYGQITKSFKNFINKLKSTEIIHNKIDRDLHFIHYS